MSDEQWVCVVSDPQPGVVWVSMYETGDTPNHERRTIKVELSVSQMLVALEALQRALGYHLRLMG
jgi:hypothetical protein